MNSYDQGTRWRQEIRINSGLDDFILLKRIIRVGPEALTGFAVFEKAPVTLGIEAMAQMAALHLRWRMAFRRHAFLLTLQDFQAVSGTPIEGRLDLEGRCEGRAGATAAYRLRALGDDGTRLAGTFLIGSLPYGNGFRRKRLEAFYRGIWRDLSAISNNA